MAGAPAAPWTVITPEFSVSPMALLPLFAIIIGAIVLRQIPGVRDIAGITLVVLGVAIHQERNERT